MNEKAHRHFYDSISRMLSDAPADIGPVKPYQVINDIVSIASYMARIFMVDFVSVAVSVVATVEPDKTRVLAMVHAVYEANKEKPS